MKNDLHNNYLYAPKMKEFFAGKKENETIKWIPLQCALLFSDELAQLSTTSRYIYFAFLLLCGVRGCHEIPLRVNYLAQTLGVNKRTLVKGINELVGAKMLCQRERETENKEKKSTDRESVSAECVNLEDKKTKAGIQAQNSQFTIEECLRYVEICQTKGEAIKNPKGLANHIFKTGDADAFILAALFPEKAKEKDAEIYGEPRQFSDEPCTVCFGAKMADIDGKGFRKCEHCLDERGKPAGFEPKGGD